MPDEVVSAAAWRAASSSTARCSDAFGRSSAGPRRSTLPARTVARGDVRAGRLRRASRGPWRQRRGRRPRAVATLARARGRRRRAARARRGHRALAEPGLGQRRDSARASTSEDYRSESRRGGARRARPGATERARALVADRPATRKAPGSSVARRGFDPRDDRGSWSARWTWTADGGDTMETLF